MPIAAGMASSNVLRLAGSSVSAAASACGSGKRDRSRSREHAAFERARDMLEGLAVPFDMVQAPLRSEVGHFGPK